MFPVLETERLQLRQLELSDAPIVQRLAGDPAIAATTLTIPHPYTLDAAEAWIQGTQEGFKRGDDYVFALVRKTDGEFIGVMEISPEREHKRAELGYWVARSQWGQGYATEAARRLIRFGFEELKLNRIYATYFTHNPASARVMQKAGMTFEGVRRQHILKNGQFIDLGEYAILREEYTT